MDFDKECGYSTIQTRRAQTFIFSEDMGFEQEELGSVIDEDGLIDPATRRAIEALGNLGEDMQEVLPIAYCSLQGVHFLDICKSNRSQVRFIRGWLLNRAS